MIRPATIHDVPRMQAVIASHAELGKMLFKSLSDLYEHLRDFAVFEGADGQPIGCVGLAIIWADLAEVRSLAVDESARGRGVGTQLVQWCIDEARRLGIRRVMSLTYEQRFFERLSFAVVERDFAAAEGVDRLRAVPQERPVRRDRHGAHAGRRAGFPRRPRAGTARGEHPGAGRLTFAVLPRRSLG